MSDSINLSSPDGGLYKAKLLDYYYTRRAESAIGIGSRFKLMKAYWGRSDLVTKNPGSGWDIAEIPADFTNEQLIGKFAESELICTLQGTTITVSIVLPEAALPENDVFDFNTLALIDDQGSVFAVLCAQQDSLYKGKRYNILLTIEQKGNSR